MKNPIKVAGRAILDVLEFFYDLLPKSEFERHMIASAELNRQRAEDAERERSRQTLAILNATIPAWDDILLPSTNPLRIADRGDQYAPGDAVVLEYRPRISRRPVAWVKQYGSQPGISISTADDDIAQAMVEGRLPS